MKFDLTDNEMEIKTHFVLVALVVVGAVNWGLHAFGYNAVDALSNFVNSLLKMDLQLNKIIYVVVALAGIMLAIKRTSWLPFLGKSVLPSSLVPLYNNTNANKKIVITTKPNSKIAYWAAYNKSNGQDNGLDNGLDTEQDVVTAYADYLNSGVVMSDNNGSAVLSIKEGAGYVVPSGKTISRHVHYRIIEPDAMMGPVNTVKY